MTQEHPITPPPELMQQWANAWHTETCTQELLEYIATQAARWGADQELEACCEYLTHRAAWEPEDVKEFCDLRRPKPPSIKQQAFDSFDFIGKAHAIAGPDWAIIRRALEALPE